MLNELIDLLNNWDTAPYARPWHDPEFEPGDIVDAYGRTYGDRGWL